MNNLILLIFKVTFVELGAVVHPPPPPSFMTSSTPSTEPLRGDGSPPNSSLSVEQIVSLLCASVYASIWIIFSLFVLKEISMEPVLRVSPSHSLSFMTSSTPSTEPLRGDGSPSSLSLPTAKVVQVLWAMAHANLWIIISMFVLKETLIGPGLRVSSLSPMPFVAPSTVSTVPLRDDASVPDPTSLQEQVVQVL